MLLRAVLQTHALRNLYTADSNVRNDEALLHLRADWQIFRAFWFHFA